MIEASVTTRRKLGGDRSTKYGGTRSIFIAMILTESEDERTVNTNKHTNDETVKVTYLIDSDSDSDEGSKCDTEDSDFVVDDEEITNLYEEEDERNFNIKDRKWESWE